MNIKLNTENTAVINSYEQYDKETDGGTPKDFFFKGALRGGTLKNGYWYSCCAPRTFWKVEVLPAG